MNLSGRVGGSFRDPSGFVYKANGRIFRGVSEQIKEDVIEFLHSDFYKRNAHKKIVGTTQINERDVVEAGITADIAKRHALWLEHDVVDFITYPYEWSFELLKSAALLHLELHIEALSEGYDIKDASAYNIQFLGCQPVFIDTLSFCKYRENSYWVGYKQFCEQFLAPLALNAYGKVDFNHWFRGALEGVDLVSASRLLPTTSFLSLTLLTNLHVQAWAMSKVNSTKSLKLANKKSGLPKKNYIYLLESLHRFIYKLKPYTDTYWSKYKYNSSYTESGAKEKEAIVLEFLKRHGVQRLLDIGCNTGYYSEKAIGVGVSRVIGTDFDCGALNVAAKNALGKNLNFTPIYFDICNPSPAGGWNLDERMPTKQRFNNIDATVSLAVVHHIVIGRNIPLDEYVDWLVGLAPHGLVEFVPKRDPMVMGLLSNREDIFPDYEEEIFLNMLSRKTNITGVYPLTNSSRVLIAFSRK